MDAANGIQEPFSEMVARRDNVEFGNTYASKSSWWKGKVRAGIWSRGVERGHRDNLGAENIGEVTKRPGF